MNSKLYRTQELQSLLDNTDPWEYCGTNTDSKGKDTEVWATWLQDDDNRKEPRTPRGMFKRLGMMERWGWMLNTNNFAPDVKLSWCVDDRAVIVNLQTN
jgi:hypothetical protein